MSELRLGIGKVIEELSAEFPALSQSKIRYLEEQGLLDPERTPAGYRKYAYSDVERLRFVLHAQEQLFWPLSHIRRVLDDMDRGAVPDTTLSSTVKVPYLSLAEDGLPTAETFVAPRATYGCRVLSCWTQRASTTRPSTRSRSSGSSSVVRRRPTTTARRCRSPRSSASWPSWDSSRATCASSGQPPIVRSRCSSRS